MKLALESVTRRYRTGGDDAQVVTAVDDVSLNIESREFVCVLGPSGCGKSTLLRLAASVEQPDSGRVLVGAYERGGAREPAGLGLTGSPTDLSDTPGPPELRPAGPPSPDRFLIFQDTDQLFFWKTALANVEMSMRLAGRSAGRSAGGPAQDPIRQEALHLLEKVGLQDAAQRYPSELSVGMRQRVAIARGLAAHPSLLLMDEPFASVDAATRIGLQRLVLDLWRETGVTVLFVTHDIHEAVLLSDRIAVMGKAGRLITVKNNPLPRPRDPGAVGDSALPKELFDLIEGGGGET